MPRNYEGDVTRIEIVDGSETSDIQVPFSQEEISILQKLHELSFQFNAENSGWGRELAGTVLIPGGKGLLNRDHALSLLLRTKDIITGALSSSDIVQVDKWCPVLTEMEDLLHRIIPDEDKE